MKLKAGQSLTSVTDDTTMVVIRADPDEVSVTCGGFEMVDPKSGAAPRQSAVSPGVEGAQLGKRYVDSRNRFELLCTKGGDHEIEVDDEVLTIRSAKPLPSSD
jgi:hypothetical protein